MSDTIVTVIGNLAEDPRQHETPGGTPITSFRVGSSQRRFDREQNKWVETGTSWYRVAAFRSLAVNALASLRKGQRVVVTGRLKLREWDTGSKQGVSAEIDAEAIGHDLLWGTSVFQRTTGRRAEEPGVSSQESATASESGGSWNPGGTEWTTIAVPDADGDPADAAVATPTVIAEHETTPQRWADPVPF